MQMIQTPTRLYGDYTGDGTFDDMRTAKKVADTIQTIRDVTNFETFITMDYPDIAEDLKYLVPYDIEVPTAEFLTSIGNLGSIFLSSWIENAGTKWNTFVDEVAVGVASAFAVEKSEAEPWGWQPSEEEKKRLKEEEENKNKPKLQKDITRITLNPINGVRSTPNAVIQLSLAAGQAPQIFINLQKLFTDPQGGLIKNMKWYNINPDEQISKETNEKLKLSDVVKKGEKYENDTLKNLTTGDAIRKYKNTYDLSMINNGGQNALIAFSLASDDENKRGEIAEKFKKRWLLFECEVLGNASNGQDQLQKERFLIELPMEFGTEVGTKLDTMYITRSEKVEHQTQYVTLRSQAVLALRGGHKTSVENFHLVRLMGEQMRQYGFGLGDHRRNAGYYVGVNFNGADLTKANLTDCNFERCDFTDANLDQAIIKRTYFTNCEYNEHTIWPRGFGSVDVVPDYYTTDSTANPIIWKQWLPDKNNLVDEPGYKTSVGHLDNLSDAQKAGYTDAKGVKVAGQISRQDSESLLPNFKAIWGNPFVENATTNSGDYAEVENWFTVEQAHAANGHVTGGVTVTPLLDFLATNRKVQEYKYHIEDATLKDAEDKLDPIEADTGAGGKLKAKQIKIVTKDELNGQEGNYSSDQLLLNNRGTFKNIYFNLIFNQERNRDLRSKVTGSYDYLVDFGKNFDQQNRYTLTSEMITYLKFLELPAFNRNQDNRQGFIANLKDINLNTSGAERVLVGEDPFACCGDRFDTQSGSPLKLARNIDFTGSKFGGRDWKLAPSQVGDDNYPLSTRIYQTLFSGTIDKKGNVTLLDLTDTNFTDCDLKGCVFKHCNLTNTNFTNADLRDAVFVDNIYANTNFNGIKADVNTIEEAPNQYGYSKVGKMQGAAYFMNTCSFKWDPATVDGDNITKTGKWEVYQPTTPNLDKFPKKTTFVNGKSSLDTHDLSASFIGADIRGCRFANIKMNCNFKDVSAQWVELTNCVFKPSKVENSRFKNMWVNNNGSEPAINQYSKDRIGTAGAEIWLRGLPIVYVTAENEINAPIPWQLAKYGAVDLRDLDFSPSANILKNNAGAYVSHQLSELSKSDLKNRDFTDSIFGHSSTDFCDLSGLDLTGSLFIDCSFNNTDFTRTKLHGTYFNRSDIWDCTFDEADMRCVKKAGKKGVVEELTSTNFGGTDLSGTTFKNCYMKETNPKEAAKTCSGANFRGNPEAAPPRAVVGKMMSPSDPRLDGFGDGRLTQLKNTKIYWNGTVGAKILQRYEKNGEYTPINPTAAEATGPNGILKQYINYYITGTYNGNKYAGVAVHEKANKINWPYGLVSEFNKTLPNDPETSVYDTPGIISQMVEGLRDVRGLTIGTDELGGNNISMPNPAGDRWDGLQYYANNAATSEPINLSSLGSAGSKLNATDANITNLNFNGCIMGNSDFTGSIVDSSSRETSFKKIDSYGLNFTKAKLHGKINFNDAILKNAIFDDAEITYVGSKNNSTSFSLLEKYGTQNVTYEKTSKGFLDGYTKERGDPRYGPLLRVPCDLTGASFKRTTFSKYTDFEHAILTDAVFEDINGIGGSSSSDLGNQALVALVGSNVRIRGSSPSSRLNASFCNFNWSKLTNSIFTNVNFKGSMFMQNDLRGTKFDNCDLREVSFKNYGLDTAVAGYYNTWREDYPVEAFTNGSDPFEGKERSQLIKAERVERQKWLKGVDLKTCLLGDTSFQGFDMGALSEIEWPVGYYSKIQDGAAGRVGEILVGGLTTQSKAINGQIFKNVYDNNKIKEVNPLWKLYAGVMNISNSDFTMNNTANRYIKINVQYRDIDLLNSFYVTDAKGDNHWADKAAMKQASAENSTLNGPQLANLRVHRNKETTAYINATNSLFTHSDITTVAAGMKFENSIIIGVDFSESNFNYVTIRNNTSFIKCKFNKAIMTNMMMDQSHFINCDFIGAKFENNTRDDSNKIEGCAFLDCNFNDASFKNIKMHDVQTSKCIFGGNCIFENIEFSNFAVAKIPASISLEQFWDLKSRGPAMKAYKTLEDTFKLPILDKFIVSKFLGDASLVLTEAYWKGMRILDPVAFSDFDAWEDITLAIDRVSDRARNDAGKNRELDVTDEDIQKDLDKLKKRIKQEKALVHYFHSDFKDSKIKNCWFKAFSLNGDTQDLRGINKDLLPSGFYDKLFNNQPEDEGKYVWDISGNNERHFMRLSAANSYYGSDRETTYPTTIRYLDQGMFLAADKHNHGSLIWQSELEGSVEENAAGVQYNAMVGWLPTNIMIGGNKTNFNIEDDGVTVDHGVGRGGTVRIVILDEIDVGVLNVSYNYDTNNWYTHATDEFAIDGPTNLERLRAGVASFAGVVFRRVNLDNVELPTSHTARILGGTENAPSGSDVILNLQNTTFSEATLTNANLAYADLSGANFSGADLTGTNLFQANLTNCNFDGTNLTDVNLVGATLVGSKFNNVQMGGIIVSGSYGFSPNGLSYKRVVNGDGVNVLVEDIEDATIFDLGDNTTTIRNVQIAANNAIIGVRYNQVFNAKKKDLEAIDEWRAALENGRGNDNWGSALWPRGMNIQPSDQALAASEEAPSDTIKITARLDDAVIPLNKFRGGVKMLGGLNFEAAASSLYWVGATKSHFLDVVNILFDRGDVAARKRSPGDYVNEKFIPRWMPSTLEWGTDRKRWNQTSTTDFSKWYTDRKESGTVNGDILSAMDPYV